MSKENKEYKYKHFYVAFIENSFGLFRHVAIITAENIIYETIFYDEKWQISKHYRQTYSRNQYDVYLEIEINELEYNEMISFLDDCYQNRSNKCYKTPEYIALALQKAKILRDDLDIYSLVVQDIYAVLKIRELRERRIVGKNMDEFVTKIKNTSFKRNK